MSLTMMKKKAYLALLIALALLLSGCTLKSVDPVADAAQVILNVNGEKVTKAQMATLVNNYTNNLLNTEYSYRPMALAAPRTYVARINFNF